MFEQLSVWWNRKPRSQRRLAVGGAAASVGLFAAGFFMDVAGKGFYEDHPFLSSLPKDLFKLVLIGTVGALLLEDLRSQLRNWPKLRADLEGVRDSVTRVTYAMAASLGFADVTLAPPVPALYEALVRVAGRLYDAYLVIEEAYKAKRHPTGGTQPKIGGSSLDRAWRTTVLSRGIPADDDLDELARCVAQLESDLNEIADLASPGTRQSLIETRVRLKDLVSQIDTLRSSLGQLSSADDPDIESLAVIKGGFLALSGQVHSLAACIYRLDYEALNGSAYPGRN